MKEAAPARTGQRELAFLLPAAGGAARNEDRWGLP